MFFAYVIKVIKQFKKDSNIALEPNLELAYLKKGYGKGCFTHHYDSKTIG